MGQTMGNAMRGGVQDGFAKLAYQVGISGVVTQAPINARLKQITSEQTKAGTELLDMIVKSLRFCQFPVGTPTSI